MKIIRIVHIIIHGPKVELNLKGQERSLIDLNICFLVPKLFGLIRSGPDSTAPPQFHLNPFLFKVLPHALTAATIKLRIKA